MLSIKEYTMAKYCNCMGIFIKSHEEIKAMSIKERTEYLMKLERYIDALKRYNRHKVNEDRLIKR